MVEKGLPQDRYVDAWVRGALRGQELKSWAELPADDLTCPRDNRPPGRSTDLLFQLRVLSLRQQECRRIATFRAGKQHVYLLVGPKDRMLHPMTGAPFAPGADWKRFNNIKVSIVEKCVDDFWAFRRLGNEVGTGKHALTLVVDGLQVARHGGIGADSAQAETRWPGWTLRDEEDPICDHLREVPYLAIDAWTQPLPVEDVVFCPVDGPVRFIVGHCESFPAKPCDILEALTGEHVAYALCPKCLGTFATTMISIS